MRRYTLLQMVQFILNDMDGDNVNSIDDTTESLQVASIIEQNFYAMLDVGDWPFLNKVGQLRPSTDVTRPTLMRLPKDAVRINEVWYNKRKDGELRDQFLPVNYMERDRFLRHTNARDNTDQYVEIQQNGVGIRILTDRAPTFWTSFDDYTILFDSYDSEVENTLQKSKTQVIYEASPTFEMSNDFIPELPAGMFTQLLEQSKANAFVVLKGATNPNAEYKASRSRRWNARKAWRTSPNNKLPNYGRK